LSHQSIGKTHTHTLLYTSKFKFLNQIFFTAPTLTAVEVWLISCIFFIFIALTEYGIDIFILIKERKLVEREGKNQNLKVQAWSNQKDKKSFELKKLSKKVEKVDGFCFIVLPVLFVFFNIIYWTIYLK